MPNHPWLRRDYEYYQDGDVFYITLPGDDYIIRAVTLQLERFHVGYSALAAMIAEDWFVHVYCPRQGINVTRQAQPA